MDTELHEFIAEVEQSPLPDNLKSEVISVFEQYVDTKESYWDWGFENLLDGSVFLVKEITNIKCSPLGEIYLVVNYLEEDQTKSIEVPPSNLFKVYDHRHEDSEFHWDGYMDMGEVEIRMYGMWDKVQPHLVDVGVSEDSIMEAIQKLEEKYGDGSQHGGESVVQSSYTILEYCYTSITEQNTYVDVNIHGELPYIRFLLRHTGLWEYVDQFVVVTDNGTIRLRIELPINFELRKRLDSFLLGELQLHHSPPLQPERRYYYEKPKVRKETASDFLQRKRKGAKNTRKRVY